VRDLLVEPRREIETPTGVARAREMGFATIVLRHDAGDLFARRRRREFILFSQGAGGQHLEKLYGNETMTAYRISRAADGGPGDG